MKIQIDSITFIDDHTDDDDIDGDGGEREIVITQGDQSVLLNAQNITDLQRIIDGKVSELSCCHMIDGTPWQESKRTT